ncbi:MAG: DPP IV N-terminal domain-containing protein [Sandaracinaceae bacterium]|nr:DPP IV N-terminal domain-containing protein [Sandaracinaceae bacterium]
MKTTASLLAALASGPFAYGCDSSSDGPVDPNPSGSGEEADGERALAPAAHPDVAFLDAYAETNRFRLGFPRSITMLRDGSGVLFLRSGGRSLEGKLYYFDAESGEERELLTAEMLLGGGEEELSAEEAARRERMRLTARGIASFSVSRDGSTLLVPLSGRLFLVDRATIGEASAIREIESDAGGAIDPRFSPDGTHVATVRDGDLYVIDVATGAEARLTSRANTGITNGLAEFVAQEEMDRMRGFWWAPDGQSILYQQTDHAGMERMHILDPMHPESEPASWPYPRPGQANAAVRLGVIAIRGGSTRWVDWDHEAYPYLCTVVWSAEGPLTILVQDREQEHESLRTVDPATGATAELFVESDDAWLNLDQTVPRWVANGTQLLWSTERDGRFALELRLADGTRARALTTGDLDYRSLVHVDETAGVAWIAASEESSETHIYRVRLDGEGEPERVTTEPGEHSAVVAHDSSLWVHTKQLEDGTGASVVRRANGAEVGTLGSEAEEAPFEPNLTFETVGRREWRTAIVRPRDFDESLRYPVILHVYGGPHARQVTRQSRGYLLDQWHADHNFIVVLIDGRGTPGRGRDWERAIDGDFISAPLEDQIEALQQLGDAHPELDLSRVGVWGWSFGGYFSAMAGLRRPDIFRAAVAGAPVSEWRDYDTHYTERYLGLPEADGEEGAYHRSSVLTFAVEAPVEDLRPMLLVHGTADDNVYFSHSLKLQNAMLRAGRPSELLALSGLTHMVPEPVVMSRLQQRVIGFFEQHLRGE